MKALPSSPGERLPDPQRVWTEEELRREWRFWSDPERDYYLAMLAEDKPCESYPLQAASLAAEEVQRFRRRRGTAKLRGLPPVELPEAFGRRGKRGVRR